MSRRRQTIIAQYMFIMCCVCCCSPRNTVLHPSVTMFWLAAVGVCIACTVVASAGTPAMPVCDSKKNCDEIWEASNLSDCIEGTCRCTGESEYVENRKTCLCKDGFVAGSTMCLPVAKAEGESCKEDVQCTTQLGQMAICEANRCYCKRNSTMVNGVCRQKKGVGQSCEYQEECSHIHNAECKQKICACSEDSVASSYSDTCIPLVKNMWDRCEEDIQCTSLGDGVHCKSHCTCKNAYHRVNNHCVSNQGLDSECSVPADCYLEGEEEGHLDCIDNRCTCSLGYAPSDDKLKCVENGSTIHVSLSFICMFAVIVSKVL